MKKVNRDCQGILRLDEVTMQQDLMMFDVLLDVRLQYLQYIRYEPPERFLCNFMEGWYRYG